MGLESFETITAVCKFLKISRTTLWRHSKNPEFPQPKKIGRMRRYLLSEIAAYFESQSVQE